MRNEKAHRMLLPDAETPIDPARVARLPGLLRRYRARPDEERWNALLDAVNRTTHDPVARGALWELLLATAL